MLITYTFKRSAKLLLTMIFATLALIMAEQSANAQQATAEVIAYLRTTTFDIDTVGGRNASTLSNFNFTAGRFESVFRRRSI